MLPSYRLTDSTREQTREALRLLSKTQGELADRSGVSRAWVSNLLTGQRPVRETELVEKLARGLGGLAREAHAVGELEDEQLSEIERTVAYLLEAREAPEPAPQPERRTRPGGAVPRDASNYVPRGADVEIARVLRALPFTMAVTGPPQGGVSTYLARLAHDFPALDKADVLTLDASTITLPEDPAQQFGHVLTALSELFLDWWDLPDQAVFRPPQDGEPAPAFQRWLRRCWQGAAERRASLELAELSQLLVLDDVSALPTHVVRRLMGLLRVLHNSRAMESWHWAAVALGVTYQPSREAEEIHISLLNCDPFVYLDWFDRAETADLLRRGGGERLAGLQERFMADYGGQPYLCHVAATLLSEGTAPGPDEAFEQLLSDRSPVERHLRAVHDVLTDEVLQDAFSRHHRQPVRSVAHRDPHLRLLLNAKILAEQNGRYEVPSRLYRRVLGISEPLTSGR